MFIGACAQSVPSPNSGIDDNCCICFKGCSMSGYVGAACAAAGTSKMAAATVQKNAIIGMSGAVF